MPLNIPRISIKKLAKSTMKPPKHFNYEAHPTIQLPYNNPVHVIAHQTNTLFSHHHNNHNSDRNQLTSNKLVSNFSERDANSRTTNFLNLTHT